MLRPPSSEFCGGWGYFVYLLLYLDDPTRWVAKRQPIFKIGMTTLPKTRIQQLGGKGGFSDDSMLFYVGSDSAMRLIERDMLSLPFLASHRINKTETFIAGDDQAPSRFHFEAVEYLIRNHREVGPMAPALDSNLCGGWFIDAFHDRKPMVSFADLSEFF